jgi:nicotinamidase-related amidase
MSAARTALIAVDVQADFLPGGSLAVRDGDAVVAPLLAVARGVDLVVATRDWHPPHHVSFAERGGPWPVHCVAGSPGGSLHPDVDRIAQVVVSKGTNSEVDAYSGFDGTPLAGLLRGAGVTRVVLGGLATDYCVRATALDALREGFAVVVLRDAVRAVEVQPGDGDRALEEVRAAGGSVAAVATLPEAQPGG